MRRLSRDVWLALGLFLVLAAITVAAAVRQGQQSDAIPLDSQSNAPEGASALRHWLNGLGYLVQVESPFDFIVRPRTRLLLMLEPTELPTADEWEVLDEWVEDGGTLVLAGEGAVAIAALRHYDVTWRPLGFSTAPLAPPSPLFQSPPVTSTVDANAAGFLVVSHPDLVPHLAVPEGPVLVSWPKGEGRIVASATAFPFSNIGLKQPGNAAFVLNVVSLVPATSRIWMDEWHHGRRVAGGANDVEPAGPGAWLRNTPAGRALLYVLAVIFVALLLGGRSFGRPLPLPNTAVRRAPLEFISALAHLGRRAGHSQAVLGQYRQELKRQLGRRYRLDPSLADEAYVQRLAAYDPRLDAAALRRLLDRLRQPQVSERELVQLAAEAADWSKQYG